MSKIEDLINSLCLTGVIFRPLETLVVRNPKSIIGAKTAEKMEEGTVPFFTSGRNIYYVSKSIISGENIFVNDGGYADFKYYNGDANYADHVISFKPSGINGRFLFYYLDMKKGFVDETMFRGSGLRNINKKAFMKMPIPVPSLEVQCEIVRILDNFTELTAELTAELASRKKQYEYYSNELLQFQDAPYETLEDLCDIVDYRGKTPKKSEEGVFLVTAKNIRPGYIDYEKSREYIPANTYNEVMHRGFPEVGDVLITTEAPCGYVAQVDREDIALAQRVIKYRPKTNKLDSTFLKYILLGGEFQEKLQRAATGGTVKGIKGSKLHKLTIPVPSIEDQQKVVSILNDFSNLCTSITEGLPAEIDARNKQYEIYRDKLLAFDEPKVA